MAMTKKERSEFDAALDRANTLAALRWTCPVDRDVPIPSGWAKSTTGWDFNAHSVKVEQMWSEASSHGPGAKRAVQQPVRQRTKQRRIEMEREVKMPATLPNDIARCAGVGGDEEGWREGCDDCARRLAESTSEVSAWMMPPAIIAFWCEFRIEPSNAQGKPMPD